MRLSSVTFHAVLPVAVWALPLGASLLATPGIVHALGPSAYGSYAVATGLAAFAAVPSSNTAIAHFTRGDSRHEAFAPFGSIAKALAIFIAINLLAVVVPAIAFSAALPTEGTGTDLLVLNAVAILMLTSSFGQLILSRLQLRQVWHQGALTIAGFGIAASLAALVTARGGSNWVIVLGAQAFAAVAGLSVLLFIDWANRLPHQSNLAVEPPFQAIFFFMSRTAASSVLGSAVVLSERLLLGSRFGPAAAGYFALAMTIAILLQAMLNSANVRFPAHFARAYRHCSTEANRVYRKAARLTFATSALGFVGILACGRTFCTIWLGPEVGGEVAWYLPYLAATMAATAAIIPTWMAVEVAGFHRLNVLLMLCIAVAWGTTILVFWTSADPHAVAYARFAGIPIVACYVAVAEQKLFGQALTKFWASLALRTLLASVPALGLASLPPAQNWPGLILLGLLLSVAYAATGFLMRLWHPSDMVETIS